VFHEGERAVQRRAGVERDAALSPAAGRRNLTDLRALAAHAADVTVEPI
jgi:hypothetical protein